LRARLYRPLKKLQPQIPRGLKPARDDKTKELATEQLKLRPFKQLDFLQPVQLRRYRVSFVVMSGR
jgi:hypothetical protein